MRFMNTYDVEDAADRFARHPVLGPATETLNNLVAWVNQNSDGWAYWPKPARAANKLMEMIERDGTWQWRNPQREDVTPAEYRKALGPIKAFRTVAGANFEILEVR